MEGTKSYPWVCPNCRTRKVHPVHKAYALAAEHDGTSYDLTIGDVHVPTCTVCSHVIVTSELSHRVSSELRRQIGLLTPEKIQAKRQELGLSHAQLATALRIGEATLIRWETGLQLQPRAMDLLMRLYFDSAEVRRACVIAPVPFLESTPISANVS